MRISDWSSDVCSSDLRCLYGEATQRGADHRAGRQGPARKICARLWRGGALDEFLGREELHLDPRRCGGEGRLYQEPRSEEHTSELQSLMRISYAVICLKKKTKKKKPRTTMIIRY